MRWPWSGSDDDKKKDAFPERSGSLKSANWYDTFIDPKTLIPSVAFSIVTIAGVRVYKSYLRRIPSVDHIKPDYFRRRSVFGRVTSVGDADNFRLYHTPGGKMAGWGLLPWKTVPTKRDQLSNQTLHIRIAGVDAPELAHWGREAQPYSKEAFDWLKGMIQQQRVRAYIYRRDQYDRVVARVTVRKWLLNKDVGLEMLKMGLATVYEAKTGAEFGAYEQQYRAAEEKAKQQKVGMWSTPTLLQRLGGSSAKTLETPREYKSRHAAADKQKKT